MSRPNREVLVRTPRRGILAGLPLPGCHSRGWAGAHQRSQPLHSEARNAKTARKSATACGSSDGLAPICGVFWTGPFPVPHSILRTTMRRIATPLDLAMLRSGRRQLIAKCDEFSQASRCRLSPVGFHRTWRHQGRAATGLKSPRLSP